MIFFLQANGNVYHLADPGIPLVYLTALILATNVRFGLPEIPATWVVPVIFEQPWFCSDPFSPLPSLLPRVPQAMTETGELTVRFSTLFSLLRHTPRGMCNSPETLAEPALPSFLFPYPSLNPSLLLVVFLFMVQQLVYCRETWTWDGSCKLHSNLSLLYPDSVPCPACSEEAWGFILFLPLPVYFHCPSSHPSALYLTPPYLYWPGQPWWHA